MGQRRRDKYDDEAERIFQLARDGADDEDVVREIAASMRNVAISAGTSRIDIPHTKDMIWNAINQALGGMPGADNFMTYDIDIIAERVRSVCCDRASITARLDAARALGRSEGREQALIENEKDE